jgi:hypothetical protein
VGRGLGRHRPKRGKRYGVTEMGWDHGRYYSRSKKLNGRVVREYIGGGRVSELVAQMDALEREQRHLDALALRAAKDDLAALDADLKALSEWVDLVARAALLAAGYRQHKRGEWRKRREHADDAGSGHAQAG